MVSERQVYLPKRMKIPAPSPSTPITVNGMDTAKHMSPVTIIYVPNNSIPMFFWKFMGGVSKDVATDAFRRLPRTHLSLQTRLVDRKIVLLPNLGSIVQTRANKNSIRANKGQ